tara:strand:+ start:426 stop:1184 length:759 start_codon:yes stop_codon:yes gene_type:complete
MTDNYHSGIDRITSSGLKILLKKSPAHYYAEYMGERTPPTSAMEYGTAGHALILEGEEAFAKIAVAKPDGLDGRTKDGKAFKEAAKDKIVLTEKDIEEMYAFKKKLKEAPEYGPLLFGPSGVAEVVMEWRDAITGAEAKCKPDWMSKDGRLIIDLKMMADADPTNFKRSVYRYGYHVSAAMYIEGVASHFNNTPTFVWAVCEKGSGNIAFYTPSAELLSEGHDKVGHGMSIYAECKQRKAWPGYSNELVEIG